MANYGKRIDSVEDGLRRLQEAHDADDSRQDFMRQFDVSSYQFNKLITDCAVILRELPPVLREGEGRERNDGCAKVGGQTDKETGTKRPALALSPRKCEELGLRIGDLYRPEVTERGEDGQAVTITLTLEARS